MILVGLVYFNVCPDSINVNRHNYSQENDLSSGLCQFLILIFWIVGPLCLQIEPKQHMTQYVLDIQLC